MHLWFGDGWDREEEPIPGEVYSNWFNRGELFDEKLRKMFSKEFERALAGQLDHWKEDKEGRIALIILCDQFSRSVFRRKKKAFDFDYISF